MAYSILLSMILSVAYSVTPPKKELPLEGELKLSEGIERGGSAFLIVTSPDAPLFKVGKPDEKENKTRVIPLSLNGLKASFAVKLPEGEYKVGAMIKFKEPHCNLVQKGGEQEPQGCFPMQGDTVCDAQVVKLAADMEKLVLNCGLPSK